jgi:hypothetical protein
MSRLLTPEQSSAINALLTAANYCSPNGKVQREFVNILHRMEREGEEFQVIMRNLVGALYDGLAYGNWPEKGRNQSGEIK